MLSNTSRGLFWSFVSAFLWSTTFICAKHLLTNKLVDPISLSVVRFSIGGLALLFLGSARSGTLRLRLPPLDILRLAGLAFLGLTSMSVLLFYGQKYTTAINSSMIMQLNPVFIMLLSFLIGERLIWRNFAAVLICLVGTTLVVGIIAAEGWNTRLPTIRGDALVLASALSWTFYTLLSKSIVYRLGGFTATTWVMLLGALELIILRLILPVELIIPVDIKSWGLMLFLGLFPTAIAFYAWYAAMPLIDLAILSSMQYLTPIFTIMLAFWFLGERLTPLQMGGIVIVLGGLMALRPVKKPTHR